MLFETLIMKHTFLLVMSFLFCSAQFSCNSVSVAKNEFKDKGEMKIPQDDVIFSEVRRLNRAIAIGEYLVITDFDQTVNLYSKLEDKRFSRSEPIPALEDNEFFLMLKPLMKNHLNGDIEVKKMESNGSVLNVYYEEIPNVEYSADKLKNPILILRVTASVPSEVKLINVKK